MWRSRASESLKAYCDIDSGSVGYFIVRVLPDGTKVPLASGRAFFAASLSLGSERFAAELKKNLTAICHEICSHKGTLALDLSIFFASPFAVSHVRSTVRSFEKATQVTSDLLQETMVRESKLFEDSVRADLAAGMPEEEGGLVSLIEKEPIRYLVNGYETSEPCGTQAVSLQADFFISASGSHLYDFVHEIFESHCGPLALTIHTRAFGLYRSFRSMAGFEDVVLVDASARTTEALIVRGGVPTNVGAFPIGTHDITKLLSKELSVPEEATFSALALSADSAIHPEERIRMAAAIGEVRKKIVGDFSKMLSELSDLYLVPTTVVLFIDERFREFYTGFLADAAFNSYNSENSTFSVIEPARFGSVGEYQHVPSVMRDTLLDWESGL